MTETPCVFIDVQRGGPSTGLPTLPAQADMMQVKWGSHGDYEIIALCPNSPQECFELTIKAFNLAEKYRVPVFLMMDEVVGHMTEKVVIPPASEIEIEPRHFTHQDKSTFQLFAPQGEEQTPEMTKAGDGYKIHVTGLTHDERGYPNMTPEVQDRTVRRLISITAWPFPDFVIRELAPKVKGLVVPELNLGQMVREVERAAAGKCRVALVSHAGGTVHKPEDILKAIQEVAR
jgi:2-oxoglutarate/2-oxoacid ferredoxin oxidoreductase subunit alpha